MKLGHLLAVILGVIGFGLLVLGIATAVDRSERAECLKWQGEARQYPGYYLTQWQAQQCAAQDIAVDAPVR